MSDKTIKNWQTHLLFHGNYNGNGFVCDMDCKFRKIYPVPSEVIADETHKRIAQQQFLPLPAEIKKNVDFHFIFKK